MEATEKTIERTRRILGVVSALVVAVFAIHMVVGCIYLGGNVSNAWAWVVWIGVALIVVHIIVAVATTVLMLTDAVNPPSRRKKNHQVLKWATGCLLLAFMAAHITQVVHGALLGASPSFIVMTVALIACLTWHSWTGVKSFTKDLGLSSSWRTPFRIIICAFSCLCALALLMSIL